ncbi:MULTISPECIES: MarR family transcriptional regulator [Rhodomicrobium]|uniref:MarR family winged helix-turn-helix transcriptional regulator n=1 Tax=Rhodomicrobium TaxID=1068 RepID=UPI000B4B64C1|nr:MULTISPECIES: MarR family transcriptional regulator [Rhodomicrobium]
MVTPPDKRLFWLLSLAYRRATAAADAGLRDLDITGAQTGALFAIPAEGAISVNDMATRLRIAQSAASAFAQRLEKAGLIVRQTTPNDSRYAMLALSERGRKVRREAAARAQAFNARMAAGLSDEQFAVVTGWLQRLIEMEETR